MYKSLKKASAVLIVLVLIMIVLSSSGIAFTNKSLYGRTQSITKVTLYRYGPDGSVKPIRISLQAEPGKDIETVLMEKCSELVDNDVEMQNFVSSYNAAVNITNISLWSHVKSWGTGEHWQSLLRFRIPLFILLRFSMFQDVPIWYKIFGINVIPFVHCNYMNDDDATTTIETLPIPVRPNQTTTVIEGRHNVTATFFFGYTYWQRAQAKWFDDAGLATGFEGYAFLTWITRP